MYYIQALYSYREDNADGELKVVLLTTFFCMLLLCIHVLILEVSWIKKRTSHGFEGFFSAQLPLIKPIYTDTQKANKQQRNDSGFSIQRFYICPLKTQIQSVHEQIVNLLMYYIITGILTLFLCAYVGTMITLRIQLIATAPEVDLSLDNPTEFNKVCVVNTPIAPPKKCYKDQ